MRAFPLFVFIPSGLLIPFFAFGKFFTAFLFDAPFRNLADQVLRWSIFACVYGYPAFWLLALIATAVVVFRDWHPKYAVCGAVFPFFVAGAPFLFVELLRHV